MEHLLIVTHLASWASFSSKLLSVNTVKIQINNFTSQCNHESVHSIYIFIFLFYEGAIPSESIWFHIKARNFSEVITDSIPSTWMSFI